MTLARRINEPWFPGFRDLWGDDTALGAWTPRLDVLEGDHEYTVAVDLPGVPKEDVKVTLENKVLTIAGEKKAERDAGEEAWHRIERLYGRFSRSIFLEKDVEADKVSASFRNGVLTVVAPKAHEARSREIAIKS